MQSIAVKRSVSIAKTQTTEGLNGYPNSYTHMVRTYVNGSGTIDGAIKSGARYTSLDLITKLGQQHALFPPIFTGQAEQDVVLVCMGKFVTQKRVEELVINTTQNPALQNTDLRTLLAIGRQYPTLCRALGVKSMRLVCLTAKLKHTDHLDHVCVLHQTDDIDEGRNALKLEVYRYGWSAEHVFAFTRIER